MTRPTPMSPEAARRRRERWIVAATAAGVFALLAVLTLAGRGFALGPYLLGTVLFFVLIYALMGLGLSLQYGFTGLVNFGQVMFALVGAYTCVLLTIEGVPWWAAMPAGVAAAASAGLLVGLPALRLREDYLAIVTIGAAEVLRRVATNEEQWTNGVFGLSGFPRPFLRQARDSDAWGVIAAAVGVREYQLVLLVMAAVALGVAYAVVEALVRSPWGRVLKSIREDESVAAALGKNVLLYKLQALSLGAAMAGLGGILFVWHTATVYPGHFPHTTTFFLWIVVILGGVANNRGTLVGAVLLWGIFETAGNITFLESWGVRDLSGPPQALFIGAVLIALMLFRPQGLLGRKEELQFAR